MGWPVSQTSRLDRSADRSPLRVACVTLPRPSGLLLVESKRKVEHATAVTFSMKEEAVFLVQISLANTDSLSFIFFSDDCYA